MQAQKTNLTLRALTFFALNLLSFLLIVYPKLVSIFNLSAGTVDHVSALWEFILLISFSVTLLIVPFALKSFNTGLINTAYTASIIACIFGVFGGVYSDLYFLLEVAKHNHQDYFFAANLGAYFEQNISYYMSLVIAGILISLVYHLIIKVNLNKANDKVMLFFFGTTAILLPILLIFPLPLMNINLVQYFHNGNYYPLPPTIIMIENILYTLLSVVLIIVAFRLRKRTKEHLAFLTKIISVVGGISGFVLLFEILTLIYPYKLLSQLGFIEPKKILYLSGIEIKSNALVLAIVLIFTFAVLGLRKHIKKVQFDDLSNDDNAGTEHGGAKWATPEDIANYGYYEKESKIYSGLDEKHNKLFLPLKNKTLVAPAGSGKTTTVTIPFLLQYNGPVLTIDIKCELWAVSARYRFEKLKRRQFAIDPFNVIQDNPATQYKSDFTKKPGEILQKVYINPFLEIPSDPRHRQRVLKSLGKSFIVRDSTGGNSEHFYKLCESFVSGSIDYILKVFPKNQQNFRTLLKLSQVTADDFESLLNDMLTHDGESANAASDILKAGSDERGGILTTMKNQLEWLVDINMQELLGSSNFSLSEFIKGDCDIYIILPAYAVESHGRLIRMIISLIGEQINLNSNNLCGKKYVILGDELAQIGKSREIERLIEVYRTYDVVLWSIFQSYSQIEKFDAPDLFKDPGQGGILQFFKTKNPDTMEWIQKVIGKKTILQKTISTNKGNQSQKNQVFGGSISTGEGESINSTGVDLVQLDEIREMPINEQWFLIDDRPVKSIKVPYYEDSYFAGRWDINPFEMSNRDFVTKINQMVKLEKPTIQDADILESIQPEDITTITSNEEIITVAQAPEIITDNEVIEDFIPDFDDIEEPNEQILNIEKE